MAKKTASKLTILAYPLNIGVPLPVYHTLMCVSNKECKHDFLPPDDSEGSIVGIDVSSTEFWVLRVNQ